MKKLFFIFSLLLFFSCQKDEINSQNVDLKSQTVLKFKGTFNPTIGISVMGDAKVYATNDMLKLKLENFSISEGPDLKVYLSKTEINTSDFISLGNQPNKTEFSIPTNTDLSTYKYVLIHCEQYNHLFATSLLNPN
jgi:Electron transfer DM13